MTGVINLVIAAAEADLTLDHGANGALVVRGPRSAERIVRALLARKVEVLTLVDLYNGRTSGLDWRHATVAEQPGRCVLCRRWALLRDPFDDLPIHKTCAESHIRPLRSGDAVSLTRLEGVSR